MWLCKGLFLFYVFMFNSCLSGSLNKKESADFYPIEMGDDTAVKVEVVELLDQNFEDELFVNGQVHALHKFPLCFSVAGQIHKVFVQDGDYIDSGRLILQLDSLLLEAQKASLKQRYERAAFDFQDQVLRAGLQMEDTSSVAKESMSVLRVRSGLRLAEIELDNWKIQRNAIQLVAPFSGKIANLTVKPLSLVHPHESLGVLIDDSVLELNFLVLQQELPTIKNKMKVLVRGFSDVRDYLVGEIISVNPHIDPNGLIRVRALVHNFEDRLLDGMKVEVVIKRNYQNLLVVPKEAVLDRQNRKVVFTVQNERAHWNYVEIAFENSNSYALRSGLKLGDQVIIKGNFDLSHGRLIQR